MTIINDKNVEEFKNYIINGKTIVQLMEIYKCTRSTITAAKKNYNLVGISPNSKKRDNGDGTKTCNICHKDKNINEFYSNGYAPSGKKKLKASCIVCETLKRLNNWNTLLITELSKQNRKYKCEVCGYNKNYAALCFHHYTDEKNFELGLTSKTTRNLDIAHEISICKVLCSNCHAEIHYPHLNITIRR